MSHNIFGHLFRFSTWGESHGPAIGCIIDGCPPYLTLDEEYIQAFLDKRRPGSSSLVSQRQEPDQVKILSGIFEGNTTGTPISLIIDNKDARSRDYTEIGESYRPGHADYTYTGKYGLRDPRGGGRSSARETASRVAAGAIARKVLGSSIQICAAVTQIGTKTINRQNWDWAQTRKNPFFCPDEQAIPHWDTYLNEIRKNGNSIGAIIEVHAYNVPLGWGAPVYGKLDADIAAALMSINAVKGVEIGDGFTCAALTGIENADEMRSDETGIRFLSNHAGGILGGISSGQPIIARMAVKPTSSILTPTRTIDSQGKNIELRTKGRHDPCVGLRAAPVAEAMLACVLADHKLRHIAQNSSESSHPINKPRS